MAEKADKADSVSKNKYLSSQTLFPILGSQNKPVGTSRGLIFPCASSHVETQSADVDNGKPNWNMYGVKVSSIWYSNRRNYASQTNKKISFLIKWGFPL